MNSRDANRSSAARRPLVHTLTAPTIHVEYARTAPAEAVTVTRPFAVGVAFTRQPLAAWDVGRHTRRCTAIPPASVFMTASDPIYWQRWEHTSESVEMWLDPDHLNEVSQAAGGPSRVRFDHRELIDDPVVVAIAARFRSAMFDPDAWDPMQIELLGAFVAAHFLEAYHSVPAVGLGRIRKLDRLRLARITDYVAANLHQPIELRTLAGLAGQSPFHLAKSFRATTGVAPYTFITDRRMDRAMVLLRTSHLPVRKVAEAVGYASFSHFVTQFRRAWGQRPQQFRADMRE